VKSLSEELESRLDSIAKMMSKNEILNTQLKNYKQKYEKFKNEQITHYEKELGEKDSEI
jgi:hypothetical protein